MTTPLGTGSPGDIAVTRHHTGASRAGNDPVIVTTVPPEAAPRRGVTDVTMGSAETVRRRGNEAPHGKLSVSFHSTGTTAIGDVGRVH
jgi:hypothetical protein